MGYISRLYDFLLDRVEESPLYNTMSTKRKWEYVMSTAEMVVRAYFLTDGFKKHWKKGRYEELYEELTVLIGGKQYMPEFIRYLAHICYEVFEGPDM